jgi:hypothetical protein
MTSATQPHEYDDAMSSFFANDPPEEDHLYESWKKTMIGQLRARAILVDMEESVVNRLQRMPTIGNLFNNQMRLTDVSGSGNNWAHGYMEYGSKYSEEFLDRVSESPINHPKTPSHFLPSVEILVRSANRPVSAHFLSLLVGETECRGVFFNPVFFHDALSWRWDRQWLW